MNQPEDVQQINLAPWQWVALNNPFNHFAMLCGISVGKTFTGAHFAIKMMFTYPELTGLIAANTYDQLSQATLREMMYWLDAYQIPYRIDEQPPKEWGYTKKQFKSYRNILSVLVGNKIVTVFTRVLSDGDALRGIEFSWYWCDETRDTPLNTHDVILSRMRESNVMKGLITTTTAGEDWCFQRFVKGAKHGSRKFGSMHVSTREAVGAGIITQQFLDTLLESYSPAMVMQEIDALHVNVNEGRAYYAATKQHQMRRAPWGDEYPDVERPLIIGCDFNFNPAPCVWMVGQLSPDGDRIHWFDEFSETQASTVDMICSVIARYGDFFLQIYGDASGEKGTTSNMGETDYNQMAEELFKAGVDHSIDVNPSNPRVKDRVENMNRLFMNGLGETHMTYDPQRCPLFAKDCNLVGWKQRDGTALAKLSGNGDVTLTHASDGAGYACYKLFPPGAIQRIAAAIPSAGRAGLLGAF